MTDTTESKMNVAALKRVDPYVKDILETATHVALYTFTADNNGWERTDIEGALFVYSRNGEPYNSVLIMNRLNTNNLVEPVTQGLELQVQEPFLLYRNSKGNIYGIWFYDKEECIRIAAMLNKLVKDSEENRKLCDDPSIKDKKTPGPTVNNIDIFSMLSKAQEDFNTTRSGREQIGSKSPATISSLDNITGPLAAPLGLDVTSQSVMDFFAKAKVNTGHFKPGEPPTPGGPGNENKPFLVRLMSHPAAHTLEHIEKQQRSITPQISALQQPPQAQAPTAISTNSIAALTASHRSKRRSKTTPQQSSTVMSTSGSTPQDLCSQISVHQNSNETNGSTGFLRIESPTNAVTVTALTNHQTSTIIPSNNANPLASLFAQASVNVASDDVVATPALSSSGSAPALIPPVMFAAPSPPEQLATRPLEPLTRNQLLQAFNYLLRSDPDFVNKLHEAYVKSFGEILS